MFRRVMVCLDDSNSGRLSFDAAVRFAAGYGSTLTGLLIREPFAIPSWPAMEGMAPASLSATSQTTFEQALHDHETAQDKREDRLLHTFRETCRARGLTHAWRVVSGSPGELIPLVARAFDLVVIGRGDKPDSALGSVASTLVRGLACPVLLVSGEPSPLSRIALAYDGSLGANRALALTADIASHWKGDDVAVVLIGVDSGNNAVREAFIEAERYLDTYHLAHRSHILEGPAAELIVEVAAREKAELLVMGAYGHSRARELLLGSTTQNVIERWKGELLLWR